MVILPGDNTQKASSDSFQSFPFFFFSGINSDELSYRKVSKSPLAPIKALVDANVGALDRGASTIP
jgi:hypothetical protein